MINVLIIDDNEKDHILFKKELANYNINILSAKSLKEAENLINQSDCVLLDLGLVDKSIKIDKPTLLISGGSDPEACEEAGKQGVNGFLYKNSPKEQIYCSIRCLLGVAITRKEKETRRLKHKEGWLQELSNIQQLGFST